MRIEKRILRRVLKPLSRNEEGQASVEFALTLMLLLAFTLFFVQLALMMAWGNYVQYATFMSARALLSAGPDLKDQQSRARDTLAGMVKRSAALPGMDRFPAIAKGVGNGADSGVPGAQLGGFGDFEKGNRNSSWQEGVRYTFKSRLFFLPLGKLSGDREGKLNTVELTSESWLLREPSADECMSDLEKRNGDKVVFDNGC